MQHLLYIALEAHDTPANHHRAYAIAISRDLFNSWIVTIRYGRCGRPGRTRHFPVASLDEARVLVQARLKRRRTAKQRIGCEYHITEYSTAPGFEGLATPNP